MSMRIRKQKKRRAVNSDNGAVDIRKQKKRRAVNSDNGAVDI
jgi:hypothetical protein